jgi:ankyrin repeat protein
MLQLGDAEGLYWMLSCSNANLVCRLIQAGLDAKSRAENGRSFMHDAAFWGNIKLGKLLLERGVRVDWKDNVGRSPAHDACIAGRRVFLKWLFANGVKPRLKSSQEGYSLIHWSVLGKSASTGMIRDLIVAGVPVSSRATQEFGGQTALHLAVEGGQPMIARALIQAGASLKEADASGHTAEQYIRDGRWKKQGKERKATDKFLETAFKRLLR